MATPASYLIAAPDWMIIDAVRYAIGRQTYQVGITAAWLCNTWPRLSDYAKDIILRDLKEAFERDDRQRSCGGVYGSLFLALGNDIDRREWQAVLDVAASHTAPASTRIDKT